MGRSKGAVHYTLVLVASEMDERRFVSCQSRNTPHPRRRQTQTPQESASSAASAEMAASMLIAKTVG
jgi:hypothetical protein